MINRRHVSINAIGAIVPIVIILISVPVYLRVIGAASYGILSLVWIVFGYFGLLDFGLSRAVTHAVSRLGGQAPGGKIEVIWSACLLNLCVSAVLGLCFWFGFGAASVVYSGPVWREMAPAVPWMAAGLPLVTISATLNGALDGEERFKLANVIQIVGAALYQLAPLGVALWLSTDIAHLIETVIVCRLVVFFLYGVSVQRVFRLFETVTASLQVMKRLVHYGFSISLINFIDPLLNRVDQLVLANAVPMPSVAAYNIASNAVNRLSIVPLAFSRSLFPKFSAQAFDDYRGELYATHRRLIFAWSGLCALGLIVAPVALRLWLGDAIAPQVAQIANVLIVGMWANALTYLPYTVLQATGRSSAILKAHLIELAPYLVLMVALIRWIGPMGAAVAWSVRVTADYFILWRLCQAPRGMQVQFGLYLLALTLTSVGVYVVEGMWLT